MTPTLQVRINTPKEIIWEGEAESVSSENTQGPFDVLPLHTNFITIIRDKKIRIQTGKELKEFSFPAAVIYVHANTVLVYANI